MASVTLVFALLMGDAAIGPHTLPEFFSSMRLGLAAFAVYSCLGVIVSFLRGRNGAGRGA